MFGYYYQPLISDMCDTRNPMTGINISMDAARWDIQTRAMFNWVPNNFSSFSFTPYAGGGYDFNGIFNATLSQMNQQNMMQYGMPLFGANGAINMPNFGCGANFAPINTTGVYTGNGNNTANNEQQKKFTKLTNLVKGLANFSELTPSKKEELLTAANRPQGKNVEEKYDYLLEVYKSVDKDIRKEYLEQATNLAPDGAYNQANKNSFYERLQGAGYELSTDLDDNIPDLNSAIDNLSNENPNLKDNDNIIGQLASEKPAYDILDVVSSWNSSEKGKNKRLLNKLAEKYNTLNESAKETAKTTGLDPILKQMIAKARATRSGLSEESKAKINTAVEPLQKALSSAKLNKIDTNLCKAFDNLYLILRQATIEKVRSEAKDYYGEIDPEVFNDELFKSETTADLKAEGFTDAEIEKGAVSMRNSSPAGYVNETEGAGGAEEDAPVDPAQETENANKQKVQDFVASDKVEEFTYNGATYYEELTKTGGRNYKRVFQVVDGELKECQGAYREGNVIKAPDGNITHIPAVVDTVEAEIESAREELTDLEYNGKEVARKLCEWTTTGSNSDETYIKEQLEKCDKENVMTFMAGIYSNDSFDHKGCEGFIEKLDDDTNIDFDTKKKFIETFIEAAIEKGIDKNDSLIKELKDLVANGRGGFWNNNGFNKTYSGASAFFGCGTNYNEKIDEVMFDIYEKINDKNS